MDRPDTGPDDEPLGKNNLGGYHRLSMMTRPCARFISGILSEINAMKGQVTRQNRRIPFRDLLDRRGEVWCFWPDSKKVVVRTKHEVLVHLA